MFDMSKETHGERLEESKQVEDVIRPFYLSVGVGEVLPRPRGNGLDT